MGADPGGGLPRRLAGRALLIAPIVVGILLSGLDYDAPVRAGWALAVVGGCTLAWWVLRARGRAEPPRALRLIGSASLLVTVILCAITGLPHILAASRLS